MITGFHTVIYSDDAEATRAFFRDVLGWPHVDAGGGWLIFKTAPSELGVHPTDGHPGADTRKLPSHESSLMCTDLSATIAELKAKGVSVRDEVVDQGFGLVTYLDIPGAGSMMLYEPRHETANDKSSG